MHYLWPLPTKSFSAGGQDVIPLRDLPKTLFGRICHLAAIVFAVTLTPTFTTAPTVIGANNVVQACDVHDGTMYRFQGGFNELRLKEYLSLGRLRIPDPDADTASTGARYFRRIWHVGPPHMRGGVDNGGTDYVIPTAALTDGECRITYGALTDISADCTAATATIKVSAALSLLDEVRVPPAYQFYYQSLNAADVSLPGRALYETLALCDNAAMAAITAGDFATFNLDLGQGDIVPAVPSEILGEMFNDVKQAGHLTSMAGEPVAANDDNAKAVNGSTPTALTTAYRIVQPILFTPKDAKLSKLPKADNTARLRWSGSQTSGYLLIGRILESSPAVSGQLAAKALTNLSRVPRGEPKVKTDSKVDYKGPNGTFMPLKVKV